MSVKARDQRLERRSIGSNSRMLARQSSTMCGPSDNIRLFQSASRSTAISTTSELGSWKRFPRQRRLAQQGRERLGVSAWMRLMLGFPVDGRGLVGGRGFGGGGGLSGRARLRPSRVRRIALAQGARIAFLPLTVARAQITVYTLTVDKEM